MAADDARAAGIGVRELQVDFDCASSKLAGYGRWLAAIRCRVGVVPVTFTALPAWLDQVAFARLAARVDRYVLQVHSLDRPAGPEAPLSLCSPARARAWVERAAQLGTPFVVALPTYGYTVSFGARGQLLGLTAERDELVDEIMSTPRRRMALQRLAQKLRGWPPRLSKLDRLIEQEIPRLRSELHRASADPTGEPKA